MIRRQGWAPVPLVCLLALGVGRIAGADAISTLSSSTQYTPVNLGSNASISTDAADNRVVIASDGQRYAFPGSDPTPISADTLTKLGAPLPTFDNSDGPNSKTVASVGFLKSSDGMYLEQTTLLDRYPNPNYGYKSTTTLLSTFHQQPDGSFTPSVVFASQPQNRPLEPFIPLLSIDINKNGLVLFAHEAAYYIGNYYNAYSLYDSKTGTFTMLPPIMDATAPGTQSLIGVSLDAPVKIDDDGRILFNTDWVSDGRTYNGMVLMTPAGVSADPLATPEPSTWLTLSGGALGWLVHRRRKS